MATTLSSIRNAAIEDAGAGGLTVYATKEDLPATNLTEGDQAYVSGNRRLYVSNGSGWYNVALINVTPTLTIDPTGAITLSKEGASTVITLTATDSDNAVAGLTFSVDSDGSFGGLATLSQDSSVFTITPLSEDSATTTSSTLTFKASDGISFGSGDTALSLIFKAANSNYTTLLLKNEETSDNQVDASTNAHTITEAGNVTSTALSPYHPGKYSWYWAGDGGDYFTITSPTSALSFGTGDFCVEMWIYPFDVASNILLDMRPASTNGAYIGAFGLNSGNVSLGFNGLSSAQTGFITSGAPVSANKWHHIVLNRESGTSNIFVNGVREYTTNTVYNFLVGNFSIFKNAYPGGGISDGNGGYLRDYRVVKGSSVYGTGTTLTVPTEPLTVITGTSLLLFQEPYISDAVGTESVSYVGGETKRFSPYDYPGYTKADHGGAVYFDGTDDYITGPTPATMGIGTGDFTIECWFYATAADTDKGVWDAHTTSSSADGLTLTRISATTFRVWQSSQILVSSTSGITNAWNHLAVVRNSGTLELFVNGVSQATVANTTNLNSAQPFVIGSGRYQSGSIPNKSVTGYISDFRITTTAVYTTDFTPPTEPLTAITNTQLLTCTNKNDIWDAGGREALVAKTGNVTASNTQRKFTTSSAIYLDGSGDNITMSDLEMGSGDLTFEFWMYQDVAQSSAYRCMLGTSTYASSTPFTLYTYGSNVSIWLAASGGPHINAAFTATTWHHVAVVRNSGTWNLYVDGTSGGTSTTSGTYNFADTTDFRFGENLAGSYDWKGYIQGARFTKGLARYTSNFTPPTAEFSG